MPLTATEAAPSVDLQLLNSSVAAILDKKAAKEAKQNRIRDTLAHIQSLPSQFLLKSPVIRALQCCLKYGHADARAKVCTLIEGSFSEILATKMGLRLLFKIFNYAGAALSERVFSLVSRRFFELLSTKSLAVTANRSFVLFSPVQKRQLLAMFLRVDPADARVLAGPGNTKGAFWSRIFPENFSSAASTCCHFLSKHASKQRLHLEFVHYIVNALLAEADETQIRTILASLEAYQVSELCNSSDGLQILTRHLWLSSTSRRQEVLTAIMPSIVSIALVDGSHLLLLALLDLEDCADLVNSTVVTYCAENLSECLDIVAWLQVVAYILQPRGHVFVSPNTLQFIQHYDSFSGRELPGSSKHYDVFLATIGPPLREYLLTDVRRVLSSRSKSSILISALLQENLDLHHAIYESIVNLVGESVAEEPFFAFFPVDVCLSRIISMDAQLLAQGKPSFCRMLSDQLDDVTVRTLLGSNRSAFLLVRILESGVEEEVVDRLSKIVALALAAMPAASAPALDVLRRKLAHPPIIRS